MPLIDKEGSLLIKCECHGHILELYNDDWRIEEGLEPTFSVTVWSQSPNAISIKNRLSIIWRMICGKTLDGGDVIITQKDACEIIKFLKLTMKKNNKKLLTFSKKSKLCQKNKR